MSSSVLLTSFFGRGDELTALVDLVTAHRLVTVTGPGGVGKTRLVHEAKSRFEAIFDEGVQIISVEAIDAEARPSALSGQLGMSSPEAVAVSLGDAPALIVLDGCEQHVEEVARFVERILATSDTVSILVTSRESLGLAGETVLVLAALPLPAVDDSEAAASPAVALFLDRAAAAGAVWEPSDDTIATVVELCQRVDSLPLAIELAATRARALSPRELLELMNRRLELLRVATRDRADRHRSVRAAIDVSVERLDTESRTMFGRLGVFTGPFDVDLAHAVAGPDPNDRMRTIDLLSGLVERSLVVAELSSTTTRYRLLELLREYAQDELHAIGEWEAANERLTEAMVVEADEIVTEGLRRWSGSVLTRIATGVDNLIGAIDWCIHHDATPERAFRLFLPLFGAAHQRASGQVRAAGERIFNRWAEHAAIWRAEALAILATAYAIASEHDRAAALAIVARDDSASTPLGRMLASRALVLAAIGRGDVEDALAHVARGRTEAAAAQLAPFERELAGFEASLVDRVGQADQAIDLATRVVLESDVAHDPITEIWARLVITNIAARAQRWFDVRAEVERARSTASSAGSSWWSATIFRSEALFATYDAVACALTDGWEASQPLWASAIERAATNGELADLAMTLRAGAAVAAALDHAAVASVLEHAIPPSNELAVLPELFPDPSSSPTIVRRARTPSLRAAVLALAPGGEIEPTAPSSRTAELDGGGGLRREGNTWVWTYRGATARVRDLKGIGDLALLLSRPGQEIHCLEVMGANDVGGSAGPAIDDRARREYQRRIQELQADIDDGRAANDLGRADRAEQELDALVAQLSGALGLGGRARGSGSAAERARSASTFRIRAAIRKVGEVHPELGRHLANSVRTGLWCSYQPEQAITWRIEAADSA